MTDRYLNWVHRPLGKRVSTTLGLPRPSILRRRGDAEFSGDWLVCIAPNGALADSLSTCIAELPGTLYAADEASQAALGAQAKPLQPGKQDIGAMIIDATGASQLSELSALRDFFQPHMRRLAHCNRALILGRPPEQCTTPEQQLTQRTLEGFVRSLGKELRNGGTAQLLYVAEKAESQLASSLRFFCGARSAYVSAQVVRLEAARDSAAIDWSKPLAGKTALVTGAARGIGAAIARTLAADGARVIGLDIPAAGEPLLQLMSEIDGLALKLDITGAETPSAIVDFMQKQGLGMDIVVHNAGVTRDKMLANMDEKRWGMVMDINLGAPLRINTALLEAKLLSAGGRIIGVSSISGIAGNAGQTNYSTSKAGVIGMVDAYSALLRDQEITVNAVAPGFIETEMTAAIPFVIRQAGRRMNSLKQGGMPVDVAETIAWIASPASNGVNGNTVRVCGQSLLGA